MNILFAVFWRTFINVLIIKFLNILQTAAMALYFEGLHWFFLRRQNEIKIRVFRILD